MAGIKGHKGQKPIREGESSKSTGVRLTEETNAFYDTIVKELQDKYPDREITKSSVMRNTLEFYKDYAKQAFLKTGI